MTIRISTEEKTPTEELIKKDEISRQRKWQIKQQRLKRCVICGKKRGKSKQYCNEHLLKAKKIIKEYRKNHLDKIRIKERGYMKKRRELEKIKTKVLEKIEELCYNSDNESTLMNKKATKTETRLAEFISEIYKLAHSHAGHCKNPHEDWKLKLLLLSNTS